MNKNRHSSLYQKKQNHNYVGFQQKNQDLDKKSINQNDKDSIKSNLSQKPQIRVIHKERVKNGNIHHEEPQVISERPSELQSRLNYNYRYKSRNLSKQNIDIPKKQILHSDIIEQINKLKHYESQKSKQEDTENTCLITNEQYAIKIQQFNQYNQQFIDVNKLLNANTSNQISDILENHQDYVLHISGKCKCFTCNCLRMCKCGFKQLIILFKQKISSKYTSDYQFQQQTQQQIEFEKLQQKFDNHRDSIQNQVQMDGKQFMQSINKGDYKEFPTPNPNPRFRNRSYYPSLNINFLTSNQVQFQGGAGEKLMPFSNQQKSTLVGEVKFVGESSYNQQYKKIQQQEKDNLEFFSCNKSTIPLKQSSQVQIQSYKQLPFNYSKNDQQQKIFIPKVFFIFQQNTLQCLETNSQISQKTQNQRIYAGYNMHKC